jgi:hypothetical protein
MDSNLERRLSDLNDLLTVIEGESGIDEDQIKTNTGETHVDTTLGSANKILNKLYDKDVERAFLSSELTIGKVHDYGWAIASYVALVETSVSFGQTAFGYAKTRTLDTIEEHLKDLDALRSVYLPKIETFNDQTSAKDRTKVRALNLALDTIKVYQDRFTTLKNILLNNYLDTEPEPTSGDEEVAKDAILGPIWEESAGGVPATVIDSPENIGVGEDIAADQSSGELDQLEKMAVVYVLNPPSLDQKVESPKEEIPYIGVKIGDNEVRYFKPGVIAGILGVTTSNLGAKINVNLEEFEAGQYLEVAYKDHHIGKKWISEDSVHVVIAKYLGEDEQAKQQYFENELAGYDLVAYNIEDVVDVQEFETALKEQDAMPKDATLAVYQVHGLAELNLQPGFEKYSLNQIGKAKEICVEQHGTEFIATEPELGEMSPMGISNIDLPILKHELEKLD